MQISTLGSVSQVTQSRRDGFRNNRRKQALNGILQLVLLLISWQLGSSLLGVGKTLITPDMHKIINIFTGCKIGL